MLPFLPNPSAPLSLSLPLIPYQSKMAFTCQNPPASTIDTRASQDLSFKRPVDDDDIEFISSNPVKKLRSATPENNLNGQTAGPVARCGSTASIRTQSTLDITSNSRGASFPTMFGNYAFPQSFPPISQQPRFSLAISPKQMPQMLPQISSNKSTLVQVTPKSQIPTPPPAPPPLQFTPSLAQVSCLNLNGIPSMTTDVNLGQISSNSGTIPMAANNAPSQSMPPPPLPTPPPFPFNTQSTGLLGMFPARNTAPAPHTVHAGIITNQHLPQIARHNSLLQNPNSTISGPYNTPTRTLVSYSSVHGLNSCLQCNLQDQVHHFQSLQSHNTKINMCKPIKPPTPESTPSPPSSQPTISSEEQPATPIPSDPPFAIPKRHKLSPNLYIDIAETVEEIFPYNDLATRHNTTPHKVFEALSAVILVPLLRYPGDKRRSSKLAQDRVRTYQQAKEELGKSQRSERVEVGEVVAHLEKNQKDT
ncbi:hypothetical protein QBC38DRAFT_481119 [Podospora fimiseda]|uniref:Uncharacterized protein n=1 Tax=Podospora fimiseda TaxID=252190 RepID=A0AAN7BNE5_9PEZI|nr:hypothetical protein QBC38DRAFT_481119 [Podospora fimiseda]